MGKSPWSKNSEFEAKDPGVKILSFDPQILSFGSPKMGKIPCSKN
jgi:hypothetical protein